MSDLNSTPFTFTPEEPAPAPLPTPSPNTPPLERVSVLRWIVEGLRASIFLRPRISPQATPGPWKMLVLMGLAAGVEVLLDRLSVPDDPSFRIEGLLIPWGIALIALWCAWCLMPQSRDSTSSTTSTGGKVMAWFALYTWASLPPMALGFVYAIGAAQTPESELPWWWELSALGVWIALCWSIAVSVKLSRFFYGGWLRSVFVILLTTVVYLVGFAYADTELWVSSGTEMMDGSAGDADTNADDPDGDPDADDNSESPRQRSQPDDGLLEARWTQPIIDASSSRRLS